jgi:plastocyanin
MPDLPDDLAALLRDRAGHAPVPPAPSRSLVRSVRRRQAARAGAAGAAGVAGVVAVVAVAAAAVHTGPAAVRPVATVPATTPALDDRYEFCDAPPTDHVVATPFGTMLKYNRGCYVVKAGVPAKLTFTNLTAIPHNLVVAPEGGEPFVKTETLVQGDKTTDTIALGTLAKGDYVLHCDVHPDMTAQLVAR